MLVAERIGRSGASKGQTSRFQVAAVVWRTDKPTLPVGHMPRALVGRIGE